MEGILKISIGILILALMINSEGQGLAKKLKKGDQFDLKAIDNRKIAVKSDRLWKQGIIPYSIKSTLTGDPRRLTIRAIKFWEKIACVKFIDLVDNEHPNYLIFKKSGNISCHSPSIGKYKEGKNYLYIGTKCSYEVIIRELGHTLGFSFDQVPENEKLKNKTEGILERKEETTDLFYKCPSCGEILQVPSGTFGTPIRDLNNPVIEGDGNDRCEWSITGAHGETIVLNIESLNIYETPNCTMDYIEVRDGYWSGSPLLGRFCGNKTIQPIKSHSDRMLVTYVKTSDKKDYYGFKASYHKVCGGNIELNNSNVLLESPNYPYEYQPNAQCTWTITYPEKQTLGIANNYFWLLDTPGCKSDFTEMFNGDDFKSHSLKSKACGSRPNTKSHGTGGKLVFQFFSENPTNESGFSTKFTSHIDDKKGIKPFNSTKSLPGSASYQSYNLGFIFIIFLSLNIFIN